MNNFLHNHVTFVLPYDLSIMLSYLTRLNNPNSSLEDSLAIESGLVELIELLEVGEVIPSIHNDDTHILQILQQVDLVIKLLNYHVGRARISGQLGKRIQLFLEACKNRLNSIPASSFREFYLTSKKIEEIFHSPGMFQHGNTILNAELIKWGQQKSHPNTVNFNETLDIARIKQLMKFAIEELFGSKMPEVNYYDARNAGVHKLFWNQNSSGTNYIVAPYKLADYLSFEFPHNATHLTHLSKLEKNVYAYFDSMSQRSFFEGLAVLSEYFEYDQFSKNRELGDDLHDVLGLEKKGVSKEFLRDFIITDRIFEFRLRAVRLMGDLMVMEGYSLEEIVGEVCATFCIDQGTARAEVTKYYSHTGLGGIYTFGYLRFLRSKIINPIEVIERHITPKVWEDIKDL